MSRREVDQALRAFKEAGDTAGCMSVLRGLEDHDIVADFHPFHHCDIGESKHGHWRGALDMLREMQRKGIVADTFTYSALISACEKGSKWERALELAKEMSARGSWPTPSRTAP